MVEGKKRGKNMKLNFTPKEKDYLNQRLEDYLRPERFKPTSVIPDPTDGRTPFDSDFSRVALSAPVRRLQDKTQVFPLPKFDFVRNRLTHSLEVLCIARGLGLGVEKVLNENGLFEAGKKPDLHHAITSILETAALVHDIGNPPFGHKIETAVQEYFKNIPNAFVKNFFEQLNDKILKEDFCNIEGNSQGFRILKHLALSEDENSYNLTMPTMATIIKYPYSSIEGNKGKGEGIPHELEKFGFLQAEANDYHTICDVLHIKHNGQRHPLTYLLEAADDIAYSVCDIEDAYKNEIVTVDDIIKYYNESKYHDEKIDECVATLASDNQVTEQCNIQSLRIKLQSRMIIECTKTFCNNYYDIIEGNYKGELLEDSAAAPLKNFCKNTIKPVFKNYEIVQKEHEASIAAQYLIDAFLKAVLLLTPDTPQDAPEYLLYLQISPNYRKVACEGNANVPTNLYKKFLLVTDYIFGMTDSFLMFVYEDQEIHDLILRVQSKIDNQK